MLDLIVVFADVVMVLLLFVIVFVEYCLTVVDLHSALALLQFVVQTIVLKN